MAARWRFDPSTDLFFGFLIAPSLSIINHSSIVPAFLWEDVAVLWFILDSTLCYRGPLNRGPSPRPLMVHEHVSQQDMI